MNDDFSIYYWECWNVNHRGGSVKNKRFGHVYGTHFRKSCILNKLNDYFWNSEMTTPDLLWSREKWVCLKVKVKLKMRLKWLFLHAEKNFFLATSQCFLHSWTTVNWHFVAQNLNLPNIQIMSSEPKWSRIECMLNACLNTECTSCFILINNAIC